MTQKIICPKCQTEFPMEEGLKSHLETLRQNTIDETKKKEEEKIQKLKN